MLTDELATLDEPSEALSRAVGEDESADQAWLVQEQRQIVQRAMAELPEAQRVPILLRFFEEIGYAEIARILDCPESTVRARVSAGLVELGRRISAPLGMGPEHKPSLRSCNGGESVGV